MMSLIPVSLKAANAFVTEHHRHHKPVVGHKFSIGCALDGRLVGVAIVGRPVSRYLDNGLTFGWTCMGLAGGKRWTGKRCPAVDLCPPQMKLRYEKVLSAGGEMI